MVQIGDYVALKPNLTLGKKYGTVTFGKYHVPYLRKVLRVNKISSTSTVYCSCSGYPCECGTFSMPMLNVAKFKVGEPVKIVYSLKEKQQPYIGKVTKIKSIECKDYEFVYHVVDDCGVFDWYEDNLDACTKDENLEELSVILEDDENQLQRKDSNLRSGEGVKGSRVHGRFSQASIRSRPLGNAKSIRGK